MKYFALSLSLFMLTIMAASAQTGTGIDRTQLADSLRKAGLDEAALSNPLLRQASFSADFIGSGNVKSYLHGKQFFDGKISQFRTASLINVPVTTWGKNSFGLSFLSLQQNDNFSDVVSQASNLTPQLLNYNKVTIGISATFSRRDSLFGKPVFYTASITGNSDNLYSVKKMSYLAGAVLIIKQNANTRVSLGGFLNMDPALSIPFIPVVAYWHKFNDGVEFNMNLPTQFGFRKQLSNRLSANVGTSITGSIAFFNVNQPGIPQNVNYTTLDLKTGPGIEYRFAKKLIFGVNGGMFSNLSGKAYDRNLKQSQYFLENKFGRTTYLNFTIAVLPFL